jgi:glycosyltransferase involved in cell wall biosynthesis
MKKKKTTMPQINMLVANYFLNESRILKETVSASKAGFKVQVIALRDYEKKLLQNESFAGWSVKRVDLTTTQRLSKIESIKLPIQYFEYIVKFIKESRSANIIHINDLETLPAAVISKLLSFGRIKILYDVPEMEPQCSGYGNSGSLKYLLRIGERWCIPFVDSTITVSNSIADWYQKHYGIVRPSVIRNIPEMNEISLSSEQCSLISKKREGSRHAQKNLSWEDEANVLVEQYNKILQK